MLNDTFLTMLLILPIKLTSFGCNSNQRFLMASSTSEKLIFDIWIKFKKLIYFIEEIIQRDENGNGKLFLKR